MKIKMCPYCGSTDIIKVPVDEEGFMAGRTHRAVMDNVDEEGYDIDVDMNIRTFHCMCGGTFYADDPFIIGVDLSVYRAPSEDSNV